MSDEEDHSESEFYYPDEFEFLDNGDLTETNNERVGDRENVGNSQEEIETFVKEQKSENTTKKTVSDMKTFHRYLSSISKGDKEILNLPDDLDHLLAKFIFHEAVDIFLYVLTLAFDSQRCWQNFPCCDVALTFYMTFSRL